MTNQILDENPNKKISLRSRLLNWVELLLFCIYALLCLDACYLFTYDGRLFIPLLLLLILSNLKFVYSSRKATLDYEQSQNTEKISAVKKSKSRLAFICTAVCLCFISILLISKFILMIINLDNSSIGSVVDWSTLFEWRVYLGLTLMVILPILQIYYMTHTSNIFSIVLKD
jgi:hypothetical protein